MYNRVIWVLLAAFCVTGVSIPSQEHLGIGMRRRRRVAPEAQHFGKHFTNRNVHRNGGVPHGISKHHDVRDDTVAGLYEDGPSAYMNTRYLQDKIEAVTHTDGLFVDYEEEEIQTPSSFEMYEKAGLNEKFPDESTVDHTNFNIVGLSAHDTESALEKEDLNDDFLDTDSDDTDHNDFEIIGQSTETEQMNLPNDGSDDDDYDSEYDALSDDDEDDGDILVQGQAILLDDGGSASNSDTEKYKTWTEDELYEPLEDGSFDSKDLPNMATDTFRAAETPDDIDMSEGFETDTRDFSEVSNSEGFAQIPDEMGDGLDMEGMASHYVQDGYQTEDYYSLASERVSSVDDDDTSYESARTIQEDDTHVNGQSMIRDSHSSSDESSEAPDLPIHTEEGDHLHSENRKYVDSEEEDDDDDDEGDLEQAHDEREAYLLDEDEYLVGDMESARFEDNEYDAYFEDADSLIEDSSLDSDRGPSISTTRSTMHMFDSTDHDRSEDDNDASEWADELDESDHDHDWPTYNTRTASSESHYSSDGEYEFIDDKLPDDSRNVRVGGFAIVSDRTPATHTSSSSYQNSEDMYALEQGFSENDQYHARLDDDTYIHSSARDISGFVQDRETHNSDDEYSFDEEEGWGEHQDVHLSRERFSQDGLHHYTGGDLTIHGHSRMSDDMSNNVEDQYSEISGNYDREEELHQVQTHTHERSSEMLQ